MDFYVDLRSEADLLIKEFGQIGTLIKTSVPDPVLGGSPAPTSIPITFVPVEFRGRVINGTTIKAGDVEIYISSVGLTSKPEEGNHILLSSGKKFRIIKSDPNNYDGKTNVVYVVHGRL